MGLASSGAHIALQGQDRPAPCYRQAPTGQHASRPGQASPPQRSDYGPCDQSTPPVPINHTTIRCAIYHRSAAAEVSHPPLAAQVANYMAPQRSPWPYLHGEIRPVLGCLPLLRCAHHSWSVFFFGREQSTPDSKNRMEPACEWIDSESDPPSTINQNKTKEIMHPASKSAPVRCFGREGRACGPCVF